MTLLQVSVGVGAYMIISLLVWIEVRTKANSEKVPKFWKILFWLPSLFSKKVRRWIWKNPTIRKNHKKQKEGKE